MTIQMLILADDITGALDSAVGFANGAMSVLAVRSADAVSQAMAEKPDVLSVNTSSREIPADQAADRVSTVLAQLDPAQVSVVFKKVDSRLKGNVAVETATLMAWAGRPRSLACPAIPGMGRVVEDGFLSGFGLAAPLRVAERFDSTIEVPDALSDDDLDALCAEARSDTLWIGARGLAFALARSMGVESPRTARLKGPVLIINGSRDPVTVAQIAVLSNRVGIISAPDGAVPDATPESATTVLTITDGGSAVTGSVAAEHLAKGAAVMALRCQPAAVVICGGETAQAFLDQFHVDSLRVTAELRPGLPVCEAELGWGPMQIVTKSGGFGAAGLLADILEDTGREA